MRKIVLLLFLLTSHLVGAQTPLPLPSNSPNLHLLKQISPKYPPIARSAGVAGTVEVQVFIAPDGSVENVKALSGPPMLQGAALDCVRHWQYQPVVVDEKPVAVVTTAFVTFGPGTPTYTKADDPVTPLVHACFQIVTANGDIDRQIQLCQKAAETVDTTSPPSEYVTRRLVFLYTSTAFRRTRQYEQAIEYANKSLQAAEKGPEGDTAIAGSLDARAQAEALSGALQSASEDLTRAENLSLSAIAKLNAAGHKEAAQALTSSTKSRLTYHAQILTAMGKKDEAAAKIAEAAKL